ncbi:unnamed protein product [Closterium sp. NIES-53]
MAAQELRWFTYLLTDLGEPPRSPPVLYVDNKAMLALCREQRLEHRTKHIALRYFLADELQQRGQLRLAYVASEANTSDVFTKALAPCDHQRCCTQLGLLCLTVLGDAVRTLQCTSDVPGGDEPHPMTPVGRVRNGVPRRHTHLLQEHERARGASTESLRDPAGEQVLREAVEEQLRPEEGAVSLAHMVSTCTQLFASSFILIHSFDMVSEQVLLSKGEVPNVLIPSIRAVRLQLNERFSQDLPILRLHSDRGGEFSSDLLRDFCHGEGITQSFTLSASP